MKEDVLQWDKVLIYIKNEDAYIVLIFLNNTYDFIDLTLGTIFKKRYIGWKHENLDGFYFL